MNDQELAEAVTAWAVEVIEDLNNPFDYATEEITVRFPTAEFEVGRTQHGRADATRFPFEQIEQVEHKVSECSLMCVVDPLPSRDASETLRGYVALLEAAARQDPTLGDRVERIGKDFGFDYDPPYVVFDDGTEGRQVTMNLTVIESLQIQK